MKKLSESFAVGVIFGFLSLGSCASPQVVNESQNHLNQKSKIKPESNAATIPKETLSGPNSAVVANNAAICYKPHGLEHEPPFFLKDLGVMLTRIMKPCIKADGESGFEKDSSWLAMGFPCTGGNGKVDYRGNIFNPLEVSFVISNDCPMAPLDHRALASSVKNAIKFSDGSNMLAFNPFAVQYWEIPGQADADTGFVVYLRTPKARQALWSRFKAGEPFKVYLYGRENAWVQGGHFYFVEADVVPSGKGAFRLKVDKVKNLSPEEISEVKSRCEGARPALNCDKVFTN